MKSYPSRSARLFGGVGIAILAIAAMFGCSNGSPTAPSLGEKTLATGQNIRIATGATLSFDRVVSDSRCAAGVVCAWEGEVTVALTLGAASGATPFTLSDHDRTRIVGGYRFELVAVQPAPVADRPIPPSAYRITIRISQ